MSQLFDNPELHAMSPSNMSVTNDEEQHELAHILLNGIQSHAPLGSAPSTQKRKFGTIEPTLPTPARRRRLGYVDANPPRSDGESARSKWGRISKAALKFNEYKYEGRLPRDHIRLLLLKPSPDPAAEIIVELITVPMKSIADDPENNQYTALSYNWGIGQETKHVKLKRRLPVKENLYAFLQEFRHPEQEVALWVDRICINQENNEEKAHQVSRMNAIYAMAANVSIWLGVADEDGSTDRAMEFVRSIFEDGDIPSKLENSARNAQAWSDLLALMCRRWFSRRWIIQELALAKLAEVRCGSKRRNWRDFADAVSIFVLNFDTIKKMIKNRPNLGQSMLDEIDGMKPLGARILVDVLANTFQRNADGTIYAPRQGLESLISSLSTFGTSDPRDTVYTLLNLAKETFQSPFPDKGSEGGLSAKRLKKLDKNPPPVPDYTLDLLQVYAKFVKWCVQESGSLDIICRHWALPELKKELDAFYPRIVQLPSWIKTVRDSTYGSMTEGFGGRRTGDSFVGTPETRSYNACFGIKPEVSFGQDEQIPALNRKATFVNGILPPRSQRPAAETKKKGRLPKRTVLDPKNSLTVKGRYIGRVDRICDMYEGIIPKQVLLDLGHDADTGSGELEAVSDAVWRTLVADRGLDGGMPPAWYHRACMSCLVADTVSGNLDTNAILRRDDTAPLQADYIKRVQAVCWNRTFIDCESESGRDTEETRLKGIAPEDTLPNDLVCILYGCSVPVILRPIAWQNGEDEDPSHYQLVGEAFILGHMDGQAVADLSEEEIEDSSIHFCLV
ncbi:heterokaryon incompatibility protein-domain-containing protein [Podospora fimiseda]|uniref:Heterokaryon incompatibility protein-domain-containing protein n=1 Tax=Podospora fimiseda TaxID=252190 RepID=A0AAN6YN29_9PEZI|nr:heterokaryon incompatibility protein-domain-containing protein [Podospora fimiseda]